MAGRLRTRLRNRRKKEGQQIRDAEATALGAIETGTQAINQFASNQPTYDQLLGGMPQDTELRGVQDIDPRLRGYQDRALERLETIGNEGWTAEDRAALDAAQRQTALQEQAQRQAVMQQAQMRGAGGGGAAIAGALMAQQAGANRNADVAAQIGMAGRDRALAAIETGAGLAGQMDAQRFGQQAARAGAIDSFNQWATGHRSNAMQQTFDNRGAAAGMQASWAPQQAAFYQDRADAVRQRQQERRDRWKQGIKGALDFGAQIGMAAATGGGSTAAQAGMSAMQGAMGGAQRRLNRGGTGGTR